MKLLIIEDEKELAENIRSYLSNEEIICELANSYQEAEEKLLNFPYDIVLLDLMLPDGNGLDILELIKQKNAGIGVLIISAKNALDDRIKGLDRGADDYLTKPFHLSELNSRMKAIFRRRKFDGRTYLTFEEIKIDTANHEVEINDKLIEFTVKEYELLLFFVTNKNRVLTKQTIAEHLWGDNVDFLDSYDFVYQHIKNMRKKIINAGGKDYLKTIYGLGYKFSV